MRGVAISREEINRLPLGRYAGPIRLVGSEAQARAALAELAGERVLGFDTETRAAFRRGESYPPALVQLAAARAVYLFRLAALPRLGGLAAILSDPGIVKAGVSLGYDLKKLKQLCPFREAGFVELEKLTDQAGIQNNGLRGMAGAVLGLRIAKGAKCTDWSRPRLSPEQVVYAATDAWACREIYLRLTKNRPLTAGC